MKTTVRVDRFEFYHHSTGNLRFAEHIPLREEHDREICGCTRNVAERPKGKPDEVRNHVVVEIQDFGEHIDLGLATYDLTDNVLNFELASPLPHLDRGYKPKNKDVLAQLKAMRDAWSKTEKHHARFQFGTSEPHCHVELTLLGYGLTDCFFANVYLGPEIDASRMMNGHSPSGVVDLSQIAPDDVWLHGCNFGAEAWMKLADAGGEGERWSWQRMLTQAVIIGRNSAHWARARGATVQGLHDEAAASPLIALAQSVAAMARDKFLAPLATTNVFAIAESIDQRIYATYEES